MTIDDVLQVVDAFLLLYIAFGLTLMAVLVRRLSRFGWSLCFLCLTLATIFLWGLIARVWDGGPAEFDIALGLRVLIVVSVTFASVEFVGPAFRRD